MEKKMILPGNAHWHHVKTKNELLRRYAYNRFHVKYKPKTWTPLRWLTYKERILKAREKVDYLAIEAAILVDFPEAIALLPDEYYWTTNIQDYETFLAADDTDQAEYVSEYYDCDDFSYRLMGQLHHPLYGGFAHGIAWSDVHAFNCFVDWKLVFYLIEPQTDDIIRADPTALPYEYQVKIVFF